MALGYDIRDQVREAEGANVEVLLADCPWRFASNSEENPGRNPIRHYPTMSLDELASIPVKGMVAPNAVLFFWITSPLFVIAAHIAIMKAWGFKPTASGFVWVKLKDTANRRFWTEHDVFSGMGFTTRKNAEFCLIGKRGKSLRVAKNVDEIIVAPVMEHSRKPVEAAKRIIRYVGNDSGHDRSCVEMFSREPSPGFRAMGNQTRKFA